jgi:phage terminase large subunit
MTSAETSIIPEFKDAIKRLGVESHFEVTSKDIINKLTGSFIWFRGIKASSNTQKANLKSLAKVNTWIVEEGEDFQDEKAFDTIDDSIRMKEKQNRVIWIQNPSNKEHFIYKRWVQGHSKQIMIDGFPITISDHPDVEQIHTSWLDNDENLTDSWIKKALNAKEQNPDWYAHNYLGAWIERPEGVIFDNWIEGEFNNDLDFGFGMDFGYSNDPTTLVKVAVDNKNNKIYLKELLYEPYLKTNDICLILQKECGKDELIVADSAEPRLIDEIWDEGYNVKGAIKGPDSIVTGIRLLQNYKLIVDPDSHNLKEELNNYQWNDRRSGKPVDDYNHIIDAIRYYVSYIGTQNEFFVI